MKSKLDFASLSLHADLLAHAHLADCAVHTALPCPGSVHFTLKAYPLHGTQTPSPFPEALLVPGRRGKLPQSCVWTKTCWGDQGNRGAQTPVLSSTNHGDCWGPPAPQCCDSLGQSHLFPSVLPLICGSIEIGRKPWLFPLLVVATMFSAVSDSCGQWEGKVPCFALCLWELGGVSGAHGWHWACTCSESSTCNCASVQIILASEGGAKCSSLSRMCGSVPLWLSVSVGAAPGASNSFPIWLVYQQVQDGLFRNSHCTCRAVLWGSTGPEAWATEPGSHGAGDGVHDGGSLM